MSPEQLRLKIEAEIGGDWTRSNAHGLDLKRCLLREPVLRPYHDSFYDPLKPEAPGNRPVAHLWLVLEDDPVGKDGYEIVYDDHDDLFGLAVGGMFIGYHGNFVDTLDAM